ncbi:MAG: 30S ribosomal protein S15 [Bdellovibrionaceae bacterium]|nr:30S ribosomal protein S15 [Pseudobdellovibrionaceae bacterium]
MAKSLLSLEEKKQIVNHFKTSELDTGSTEVQVALLTFRILRLTEHFKNNKHDYHSRQGLTKAVNRRRKLLDYLKGQNEDKYLKLIEELNIRK